MARMHFISHFISRPNQPREL